MLTNNPLPLSATGYLEGEVEVLLDVSLVAQQLSQTMSQLLQTDSSFSEQMDPHSPPQSHDFQSFGIVLCSG